MQTNSSAIKGSVVIYIVLLIFMMMTSAAIVLSTILSKHVRAAENYLSSEQSFAAANSGIEDMLYQLVKGGATGRITSEGTLDYGSGAQVTYRGDGCVQETLGKPVPHVSASGTYKAVVRRIELGGGSDGC